MFRIFRKNKKKDGAVEGVAIRPVELADANSKTSALDQRLLDTQNKMGKRLAALFSSHSSIDDKLLDEIEITLITADLGAKAAIAIVDNLRAAVANKVITEPAQLLPAVQAELYEIIEPCEQFLVIDESKKPFVILMVGINGAGKTTTIGKLAQRYKEDGLSVLLTTLCRWPPFRTSERRLIVNFEDEMCWSDFGCGLISCKRRKNS